MMPYDIANPSPVPCPGSLVVKKGSKIEVMLNVAGDLGLAVAARVVGGLGGVRGSVKPPSS